GRGPQRVEKADIHPQHGRQALREGEALVEGLRILNRRILQQAPEGLDGLQQLILLGALPLLDLQVEQLLPSCLIGLLGLRGLLLGLELGPPPSEALVETPE